MKDFWDNVIITDIKLAMLVEQGMGVPVCTKRSSHGFVINDSEADKIIHFSDGIKIKSGPNELHYLPKGSTYCVEKITSGNCWAINFNLLEEIEQPPFNINFRNPEPIIEIFKEATNAWKEKKYFHNTIIKKCIYEIIAKIKKEQKRNYIPTQKEKLITPAVEYISKSFTENNVSVKKAAELCGISESYLRRIFTEKYSISPKEYIIKLRLDYAKQLLKSGQLSVSEIATMCGYFEPCHFSREFSKRTGISPSEYEKASRQ
jgi:AraC-like DNA-binding protein